MRQLSVLIQWTLEGGAAAADSMAARGYGLPGRTAYTNYRLDGRDRDILLFLAWYCVALASNCTDTTMGVYISVAMIGIAVGAAANFIVSLPASVFGRHGFTLVNSVFFPLMQIVLMTNYVVNDSGDTVMFYEGTDINRSINVNNYPMQATVIQ